MFWTRRQRDRLYVKVRDDLGPSAADDRKLALVLTDCENSSQSGSDPWAAPEPGRAAAGEMGGMTEQDRTTDPQEIRDPDTAAPSHLKQR